MPPSPPPPAPAPSAAPVWSLIAQIAFGLLAMTICLPSMQEWGALFGSGQPQVQLTFSAYVVAFGAGQFVHGPLSDRLGRRRVLLAGLALAGVASLAAALASSIEALVAARAVQGAGAAAGMVVGRAAVQDLFEGPQRTRVMAFVGMAMGLCPPLATVIGGQIHAGLGWQANFLLTAGVALALVPLARRALPAAAPRSQDGDLLRAMGRAYARLLGEPAFLLYVAILALTSAVFYAFLGGAPHVLRSYDIGPGRVGWYMMSVPLAYIVGNYLTSRFVRHVGERRIMVLGQLVAAAGIATMLVLALAGAASPLAFSVPLVLLGLGHGLLMPPCLAGTVGIVPALAGAAAGLAGVTQQLTGAFGGYVVGLVRHDGPVNLGWVMLLFTLGAVLAQAALQRRG